MKAFSLIKDVIRECGLFGEVTPDVLSKIILSWQEKSLDNSAFRKRNIELLKRVDTIEPTDYVRQVYNEHVENEMGKVMVDIVKELDPNVR